MQNNGHTPEWTGPTVERLMHNGKRVWASAFKAWMVEQAVRPDVSVSGLALRHGVNANLLRHWMKLRHWHSLPAQVPKRGPVLLPVSIAPEVEAAKPTLPTRHPMPCCIEIEVGGALVRIREGADAHQLRMVLDALRA